MPIIRKNHNRYSMSLSQDRLSKQLGVRPFQYFDQVDSTQGLAINWLLNGAQPSSVVIADEQLKGRGRVAGRTWYTPPGVALALSVILKPREDALPQVMMLGALAIAELLEFLGAEDVSIKWPNDVLLNGKKVSGVLPEAEWQGNQLIGVVLGMGLNVRVDFAGTDVEHKAISIEPALNKAVDRAELLTQLLDRIDYWSTYLGSDTLFKAWKSRLVTMGQEVTINGITGIAESVQEDGSLILRDDAGVEHRIIAGEIQSTIEGLDH